MFLFLLALFSKLRSQDISAVELFPQTNTIQAETNYELKMLLKIPMPINTQIVINFTNTDIIVPNGALSICIKIDVFNTNNQLTYTQCSCSNKICTIIIPTQIDSGSFFLIRIGTLTNPDFVKSQIVQLSVNFGTSISTASANVDVYSAGQFTLNSVSQSSFKVSALNDLGISLNTQHTIPNNGLLLIAFPTQIGFTNIQVKCLNGATNSTGTITYFTSSVLVKDLFLSQITPNTQLIIYIIGTQNQESVRNSNQISLQSATKDSYLIDSMGISISTTIPEDITINTVTTTDTSIVNSIATFQFNLSPALKFISGGYLQITFPSQLTVTPNMKCTRILGLTTVTGNTYSCSNDGQIVKTVNLQYPNLNNALILIISAIKNPQSIKPTDKFEFRTFDLDGYLICVASAIIKFTASVDTLTQANFQRITATVGMESKYQLTVQNKNLIPSNGMYMVELGNQAIKSTTTTLNCNIGTTTLSCQYIDNQNIKIIVNQIEIGTILVIELNPLLNPNYVITDLSTLSVWSSDSEGYGIDKLVNVNINSLIPISMLQIIFWRDSTIISKVDVGSIANIKIQFNVPSQYIIDNDGHLIIDLKGYYWRKQSESIICQQLIDSVSTTKTCSILSYIPQVGFSMQLIQQLQIQNVCQTHQSQVTVMISGLRNSLLSGTQNQIIEIQVTTINSYLVSTGQSDLTLGTTQFENTQVSKDLLISTDSPITGISTQYTLLIDLNTPLDVVDRNSYIEILIPTQIDYQSGANCISLINQQSLSCTIVDKKIKITSNLDPFTIVDKQLSVKIASLRNPYSTSITDNFIINQYYASTISVQYKQTYQATQPRDITVIIQRLPTQAGKDVQLQYSFKLDNAVDTLSIIIILPNDQVQNIGQLTVMKNNAQLAAQLTTNSDSTTTIQFIESSCPCTINTELIYQISNVQNPITTKQLISVSSIQLLNNQAKIYQQNMSIVLPKCSVGTIVLSQLSQTGTQLQQDTIITFVIDTSTPISNGIIIIQFINITPYINQPTIIINSDTVTCTLDTKQITCNNINILSQNQIVLSNIKTIKWLNPSDNCQFKILTLSQDNDQIDVSETLDCSKLIQLPISQFSSTVVRNNRLLSYTTDLTLSFNQDVNVYLQIAIPLSEVKLDALFHANPQPTTTQDTSFTYFNFVLTTNIQTITIYQLQNADSLPSSIQQYTVKLSNDGVTTSYQSTGTISPSLQCVGTQCSGNPLLITNYTHNILLIGQKTDITIYIQLPFQLKEMTELLFNSTQLSLPDSRNCYLNDTLLMNCQYFSCNSCDQTVLIYQIKNAVNLDEYYSNERVCVSVLSTYESISTCNTFTNQYNYLLDIRDISWTQALIYASDGMVQFFIKPTSTFSASIATYLQFEQQGDFSNAKAYFNNSLTTLTSQNNNANIQICMKGCQAQIWYQIRIENIIFSETINQNTKLNIMRNAQILDTSIIVSFYPKLLPNQLELISITAIDYVQLKYNITSFVGWKTDSKIIFIFIDNCILIDTSIKYQINSTCNLKQTQINEIQIVHNNIVTHILQQNILVVAQLQQCPIPLLEYKEQCITSCPIKTYSQQSNNVCVDCIQNNCQKCNQDSCLECNSNFVIVDKQCQLICNLNNCNQCQLIDFQILCTQCTSPFELYQGSCYNSTDCYLENCENCLISNQQFQCQKCSPDFYYFQSNCVSQCENGYFPNEDQCIQCVTGCSKCSSFQCEECQQIYKLDNGQCVCNIQNCNQCSKQDTCDQCLDKFILYNNQCISQCPFGFYLDENNNSCEQCQQQECTQCDNKGCLTCIEGYILNGSMCLPKICPQNCEECEMECTKCSDSYELTNGECVQYKYSPYFGEISISYLSLIIVGLGYMIVSLIMPPSIPLIPQIIICTIIVFTTIQTLSGLLILLYFLINGLKLDFILISISFSATTILNSLTSIINPNPLTNFLSGGTWFRIGLSKLRLIKKQKTIMSDYLIMRYQKQKIYFIGTGISILIDIVLVALQSENNESAYLGSIRIVLDILLMIAFYLEHRLI